MRRHEQLLLTTGTPHGASVNHRPLDNGTGPVRATTLDRAAPYC
jgi:hypothetical protein